MENPALVKFDTKLPDKSPINTYSNGEDESLTAAQIAAFNQLQATAIAGLSFHKRLFKQRKRF